MPINYGVYQALRSRPSFEQKAKAAQMNLGYLSELNKVTSAQTQQRLQSEEAVQSKLAQFADTEGLERDKQDLLSLMKKEEGKIIKGIRDSGGSTQRYINSGGLSDLRKYYTNIKSSEQMQNTINNQKHNASYQEALNKGMLAIPSVMHFDADGNVTDAEGSDSKRSVSFGEQLAMYEEGKIDQLSWQGAEKPMGIKPGAFQKIPNPRDPLKAGPVRVDELQQYLIGMGQNPLIANMIAEKSRVGNTDNTQYMYGVDPYQVKMHSGNQKVYNDFMKDVRNRQNYDNQIVAGGYADVNKDAGFSYFYKPGAAATGHQKAEITDQASLKQGEEYRMVTETPFGLKFQNKQAYDLIMSKMEYVESENKQNNKLGMSDENKQIQQYFMRTNSGEMAKMNFDEIKNLNNINVIGNPQFIQMKEQTHIGGTGELGEGKKRGYMKFRVEMRDDQLQDLGLATNWLVGEDIIDKAQTNIFGEGNESYDERGNLEYQFDMYVAIPDRDYTSGKIAKEMDDPDYLSTVQDPRLSYQQNMMSHPTLSQQDQQYLLQYLMEQQNSYAPNQSSMTNP